MPDEVTEENIKAKEQAVYKIANIYKSKGLVDELIKLQKNILPLFIDLPQSKTGKIVRTLFDMATKLEGRQTQLIELCGHIIEWCDKNNRSFLRMRIENKLGELYFS